MSKERLVDRDRSEWTSACSAHLQIEGKSNHITHVGLSKTLASSKLGVPDVLANLLGLLAEIPKYCVLGFCVALVIKKQHPRIVCRKLAE